MLDSLKTLLQDQVRDLYSAEAQLVKAIPKMAKAATSENLRNAFIAHLEQTREHVQRLDKVAEMLETKPGGKKCKAAEGLVAEAGEVLDEDGEDAVIDAALIAAARRVEHYEISAYGSAIELSEQLGEDDITRMLQKTLDEEIAADKKLTGIAIDEVLPAASETNSDSTDPEVTTVKRRTLKPR